MLLKRPAEYFYLFFFLSQFSNNYFSKSKIHPLKKNAIDRQCCVCIYIYILYIFTNSKKISFASVIRQQHCGSIAIQETHVHSCVFGWISQAVSVLLFPSVPNSPASEQTSCDQPFPVTIDFSKLLDSLCSIWVGCKSNLQAVVRPCALLGSH